METENFDGADQAAQCPAARQRAIAVAGKARSNGDKVGAQFLRAGIRFAR